MSQPTWSNLRRHHDAGHLNVYELAARLDLPLAAVIRKLKAQGSTPKYPAPALKFTPTATQLQALVTHYQTAGLRAVAQAAGKAPNTIRRILREAGVPLRPPGRPPSR